MQGGTRNESDSVCVGVFLVCVGHGVRRGRLGIAHGRHARKSTAATRSPRWRQPLRSPLIHPAAGSPSAPATSAASRPRPRGSRGFVRQSGLPGLDRRHGQLHEHHPHVSRDPGTQDEFGRPSRPELLRPGGWGLLQRVGQESDNTTSTELTASDGKFGFNLGAGVGFPMGPKTKINFMGNYHSVSTNGQSTNYLGFRAGLGLSL